MEKRCIYCGESKDLSKSDIIPDALTNAKIINPNVCRVEHNNNFSDLFESEVIEKLAFITNELDIKSSKSKNYPRYETEISIEGVNYNTNISSETEDSSVEATSLGYQVPSQTKALLDLKHKRISHSCKLVGDSFILFYDL